MDKTRTTEAASRSESGSNTSSYEIPRRRKERFSEEAINQNKWMSNTKQTSYSTNTLIGNWYEDVFDIKNLAKSKCVPSQYNHYFETTYRKDISKERPPVPKVLAQYRQPEAAAYPAHQPILDTSRAKAEYNSYISSYSSAYTTLNTVSGKQEDKGEQVEDNGERALN
ncbi:hypothetical protein LOD99_12317 [Oopsacas minuta]|uniref:Uncharacterized protein n=1 Tax=Oopsacas minuta TaxID=111878 RepID=A0AAV7JF15_9METZ|nr:hypothetical protein LOD99_12317 [Oopsacas minuta]